MPVANGDVEVRQVGLSYNNLNTSSNLMHATYTMWVQATIQVRVIIMG